MDEGRAAGRRWLLLGAFIEALITYASPDGCATDRVRNRWVCS